jgi:dTDP-glucose 4,6-dehydratase
MNILVTGGAGFIGSNFILYWLKKYPHDRVINFDKLTYAGNLENLRQVEGNANYRFIKGDICDNDAVTKAMEGIDVVVHFAAESHVDRSIMDPSVFVKTNILGTQILLENSLKNKIKRFHHVSTDEVFGQLSLDTDDKFNEDTKYAPRSPYAASKAGSDFLVKAFFHTYGLPVTLSNCSNNYGPYQFPEKFIPLAITNIIEGKKVPVYGDGKYVRDWLYVLDHCRAIDLIINKGKTGQTYCIGGVTDDISNMEILKKILKIMDKNQNLIEFVKDRPGHDRRYSIDWKKINRDLGWEPQFGIDRYLQETVQWYIDNQSWWRNVKSGEYQKYYKTQYHLKKNDLAW